MHCCFHLQEIEVMCTIVIDECKEAEDCLQRADSQIGEIRHYLHTNGTALVDCGIKLFSARHDSDNESLSLDQAKERNYRSPTPSDNHDNNM